MPTWFVFGNQSRTSVAGSGAAFVAAGPAAGAQAVSRAATTSTTPVVRPRAELVSMETSFLGGWGEGIGIKEFVLSSRSPILHPPLRLAMPGERDPLDRDDGQEQGDAEQRREDDRGEDALGQELV